MKLYTYVGSERGKKLEKSGNEYLTFTLSVNRRIIGTIELYYNDDIAKHNAECDEWVLSFRHPYAEDADIIAQGNTSSK